MPRLHTTLRLLVKKELYSDCIKLKEYLGEDWGMNEKIDLLTVLDVNGVESVMGVFCATLPEQRELVAEVSCRIMDDLSKLKLEEIVRDYSNLSRRKKAIKKCTDIFRKHLGD